MRLFRLARALAILSLAATLSGCSESLPTPPTAPSSTSVSGRWYLLDANGPTTHGWTLVQRGTSVEGTSLEDPSASVPYTEVLAGEVTGSEFTFSGTATQYFPQGSQQTRFSGTMTITAGTMSGNMTWIPPIGKVNSRTVTIMRAVQGQ